MAIQILHVLVGDSLPCSKFFVEVFIAATLKFKCIFVRQSSFSKRQFGKENVEWTNFPTASGTYISEHSPQFILYNT